jgi:rhodanese-related sulfurtransferase
MVGKIYSRQFDLSIQGLERDAAELGLDRPRFNQCLSSGAMAGRVRQDVEDGRALGVRATPTFFSGQKMIEGVMTAAQFSQLVAGQLADLGVTMTGNVEPAATPAAAAPKKPATNPAATGNPLQESAATTQPAPSIRKTGSDPGQASTGLLGVAPGGSIAGWQVAAPGGPFGAQTAGGACSEADAAKKQPALIDTQELRQLLTGKATLLFVDVRPASDYAAGRISGAISLPVDEIDRRWNTLPKDRTIILYESGRSSGDICAASRAAGRTLLEHGFPFSQVKVYQDGLVGWEGSGIGIHR